ncbi:hypothetical protein BD413DRAFT_543824 [Trametes elegans]|nr:hypothetical protein BD413DRAFT_543824 [Trametes elegans]
MGVRLSDVAPSTEHEGLARQSLSVDDQHPRCRPLSQSLDLSLSSRADSPSCLCGHPSLGLSPSQLRFSRHVRLFSTVFPKIVIPVTSTKRFSYGGVGLLCRVSVVIQCTPNNPYLLSVKPCGAAMCSQLCGCARCSHSSRLPSSVRSLHADPSYTATRGQCR